MKEQILKIAEMLKNDKINEIESRKLLFGLFGVMENFPQNIDEIANLKDKIYGETIPEMDMDTVENAYEHGIEYAIHELCLNR